MTRGKADNTRLVYSTETGRIRQQDAPVPADPGDGIVRVSRTKAGRGGKTVTLVTGVPAADLTALGKELKRVCGTGGAVKDGVVELQGDHVERVLAWLQAKGYKAKRAGG